MEQLNADTIDPDNAAGTPGAESLSDYVQRMETDENLRKLAEKLKNDLAKPVENEDIDVSKPDVSTPNLSFEKFEEKRTQRDGQ
ncbi:hypothetical protein SAMN05216327_11146 [Dyadobacter sp. SG02]|uniref:hypothetical protein n=1 Tax=Dyadobacter sp. SG02 TaxID=1855291 RepID=UPI0008ADB89A|nr:hypothetical protein [Dyadobacter sp. SG02]SEJ47812.1 hypothetical protein SAMN05216327_11146 [Dyadobacter sp. SG02]